MRTTHHYPDAIYHSQRNNMRNPGGACGPTSVINALQNLHIDIPFKRGKEQLEDLFYEHLHTPDFYDWFFREVCPTCKASGQGHPRNFTVALEKGINDLLPGIADRRERTLQDVILSIEQERAIHVIGGKFTGSGHFVSLVGLEYADDGQLLNFIVDDSWGDYMAGYRPNSNGVHDGNNRRYPAHVLADLTWGDKATHPTILFQP